MSSIWVSICQESEQSNLSNTMGSGFAQGRRFTIWLGVKKIFWNDARVAEFLLWAIFLIL